MTRAETILDAVIAVLQTVDGTGSYTYDLSGDDGVHEGTPGEADVHPPCVWLDHDVTTDDDQLLTVDQATLTIVLRGFAPTATSPAGVKARARTRLFSDCERALTASFAPGGTLADLAYITSLKVRKASVSGSGLDLAPDCGAFTAVITITYPAAHGAGV